MADSIDFSDIENELKKRLDKIDTDYLLKKKAVKHETRQSNIVWGELYSIHKRSLPVGLDQPIMWNLPKDEAEKLIKNHFKAKLIDEDKRIVHYYDKVKQDRRYSVCDNTGIPLTAKESKQNNDIWKD